VLWNPGAFYEDAIRFPLGLGVASTGAGTPSAGSALVHAFPGAKAPITATLVIAVAAVGAYLRIVRRPRSAADAARAAGLVLLAAIVLTPSPRAGYVVYPIDLLVWSWALRAPQPTAALARPR